MWKQHRAGQGSRLCFQSRWLKSVLLLLLLVLALRMLMLMLMLMLMRLPLAAGDAGPAAQVSTPANPSATVQFSQWLQSVFLSLAQRLIVSLPVHINTHTHTQTKYTHTQSVAVIHTHLQTNTCKQARHPSFIQTIHRKHTLPLCIHNTNAIPLPDTCLCQNKGGNVPMDPGTCATLGEYTLV